ncbi:MAG: serine/threonine protein kinase [Armatimonadetes bacterium]|nr:serine/threonine protein kinase [Armatimonadota bacterium]
MPKFQPLPLREGTLLDDRYAVGRFLGRGGFGITYLVEDLVRGDDAVLKELAPQATRRLDNDDLDFSFIGPAEAQRLRRQFTAEARILRRVAISRVPNFRSVFDEHQTAYLVTDYVPNATPLSKIVAQSGAMSVEDVTSIVEQLLESLEQLHRRKLLHLDVKPSNVLLADDGQAHLIDFGSARQWHADLTSAHGVQFSPSYAPPEQILESERRSPATDLYSLAALAYTLLTGIPPTGVHDRLAGTPVIPLMSVRPDTPPNLAAAVESALSMLLAERPQSAEEFRAILHGTLDVQSEADRVLALDEKRSRLLRFKYSPRQCPACGNVLDRPEPLGKDQCPVCREGRLKMRNIHEQSCATCRGGILHAVDNEHRPGVCPKCDTGIMKPVKRFGFLNTGVVLCGNCDFALKKEGEDWRDGLGTAKPWSEWHDDSGRAAKTMICDVCRAQFDVMRDGRWERTTSDPMNDGWTKLYPDEWARVAAGLRPDSGNCHCEACGADFFRANEKITLLSDDTRDPYGFVVRYGGELLRVDLVPWLAVGKESGKPGFACHACETEFDDAEGESLELVHTGHAMLRGRAGERHSLEDWHRISQDLPASGDEDTLDQDITDALREAYQHNEIALDPRRPDLVWKGRAADVAPGTDASIVGKWLRFVVNDGRISLGLVRKRVELVRDVASASADNGVLTVHFKGIDEPWHIQVEPITLSVTLESGKESVELSASDLARRLTGASAMPQGGRRQPQS